jgi:hypothetical protein
MNLIMNTDIITHLKYTAVFGGELYINTPEMKITASWDVALCSLIEVDRRFTDSNCLLHHGDPYLKRLSSSFLPI